MPVVVLAWLAPALLPADPVDADRLPCFVAAAWPEADALFRRDPRWLGADVASSVDLGDGRVLWLFGDTWIDPSGSGDRRSARMISNSVGVQTGSDPSQAGMSFHWGSDADGQPRALFPDEGPEALWFGHGVNVDGRVVLFFARTLRNTGTGLGFEHAGWGALMVENPGDEPSRWRTRMLDTADANQEILLGYASAFADERYVYAFGSLNADKSHPIHAARWRRDGFRTGDLGRPAWWAGEAAGWVTGSEGADPQRLFGNAQTDLSIHRDSVTGRFVAVHTVGFGPAVVGLRSAPALAGPWSDPDPVYRPPEFSRPDIMIYSAKAHPALAGADLVVTYATNSTRFEEHFSDPEIYYPRFVRFSRCTSR
jgi:hypothetical protein